MKKKIENVFLLASERVLSADCENISFSAERTVSFLLTGRLAEKFGLESDGKKLLCESPALDRKSKQANLLSLNSEVSGHSESR